MKLEQKKCKIWKEEFKNTEKLLKKNYNKKNLNSKTNYGKSTTSYPKSGTSKRISICLMLQMEWSFNG